jgi:hypothetical protein
MNRSLKKNVFLVKKSVFLLNLKYQLKIPDCHIKLYETSSGKLKEFQDVVAQNVGWSIVDTAYR